MANTGSKLLAIDTTVTMPVIDGLLRHPEQIGQLCDG